MMQTQHAAQKPPTVKMAVNLLWASIAVGIGKALMEITALNSIAPAALTNLALAFSFALMAFMIVNIGARKNWARIIFLVMFVVGTLPTLLLLQEDIARSPLFGLLSITQICLQAYAMFLLFSKPGSDWFRQNADA